MTITRTMSHCLPSKGTSCGCLISLSNESSKVSFSHAHLAHVGHKALANFFFIARVSNRRQSATSGDYRRQSTTIGDSRRRLATIGMYTSGRGPKKVHLSASILNEWSLSNAMSSIIITLTELVCVTLLGVHRK